MKISNLIICLSITCSATFLTGCATSGNSNDQTEWVGGIFGGNVVYTINQLGPNKYQLDADTVASVKPDQLITVANARANRLCAPKTAHYEYQLTSSTYMETVTAVLSMPAKAPKVTGIVTCQ